MDTEENHTANKVLIFGGLTFLSFWVWLIVFSGAYKLFNIGVPFPIKTIIGFTLATGYFGIKAYDKYFINNG